MPTTTSTTVSISLARSRLSALELEKAMLDRRIAIHHLFVDYLALLIEEADAGCYARGAHLPTCFIDHRELGTTREALRARARKLKEDQPGCRIFSSVWWSDLGIRLDEGVEVIG